MEVGLDWILASCYGTLVDGEEVGRKIIGKATG